MSAFIWLCLMLTILATVGIVRLMGHGARQDTTPVNRKIKPVHLPFRGDGEGNRPDGDPPTART